MAAAHAALAPTALPAPPPRSYVGEWFEAKAEPGHTVEPLEEQQERAVHNLWVATGIYAGFVVFSGVFVCIHKLRGRL